MASSAYDRIYRLVSDLIEQHPGSRTMTGADFNGLPQEIAAVKTLSIERPDCELRLGICLPEGQPAFDWTAEITFVTPDKSHLRHYLLLKTGRIAEAYGRNLSSVAPADAEALYRELVEAKQTEKGTSG